MLLEKNPSYVKTIRDRSEREIMIYEQDEFNTYQNFLYKRVLFGLSMYEPDQLKTMHFEKKKRISKVHIHAQQVLNLWKQQVCMIVSNGLLRELSCTSKLVKEIIDSTTTDLYFTNALRFKDFGITKKQIVNKLIKEGVLPGNFYELKPESQVKSTGDHVPVFEK